MLETAIIVSLVLRSPWRQTQWISPEVLSDQMSRWQDVDCTQQLLQWLHQLCQISTCQAAAIKKSSWKCVLQNPKATQGYFSRYSEAWPEHCQPVLKNSHQKSTLQCRVIYIDHAKPTYIYQVICNWLLDTRGKWYHTWEIQNLIVTRVNVGTKKMKNAVFCVTVLSFSDFSQVFPQLYVTNNRETKLLRVFRFRSQLNFSL